MPQQFINNFALYTTAAISDTDTLIPIPTAKGEQLAFINLGDFYKFTLDNMAGSLEIVKCTGYSGGNLIVERGQEGTKARTWRLGSFLDHRITAQYLEDIQISATNGQEVFIYDDNNGAINLDVANGPVQMIRGDPGAVITLDMAAEPTTNNTYAFKLIITPISGTITSVSFTVGTFVAANYAGIGPGLPTAPISSLAAGTYALVWIFNCASVRGYWQASYNIWSSAL